MNKTSILITLFTLVFAISGYSQIQSSVNPPRLRHGPEKGSLLIIGGGNITPEIWKKFTELAGGIEKARIVVITAAIGDSAATDTKSVERVKTNTGIKNVIMMHPKNVAEANSDEFIRLLKTATGIFFVGGRQWRIADAYLNTLTQKAFETVLERGGVIAGTSAGATIQGSFLWRGDTKGSQILVGDHTVGFGYLRNSVIDQHLLTRNRMFDLVNFVKDHPGLIGIGLDEATAVLIQKDILSVIGKSYVAIYDYNTIIGKNIQPIVVNDNEEDSTNSSGPFFFLHDGQKYDLGKRSVIKK